MAGQPAGARRGEAGERVGGSNSVVESQPSKLLVAGSIPVSRSTTHSQHATSSGDRKLIYRADVAQLAEHVLGKDEVTSSILVIGSILRSLRELRMASQRANTGEGCPPSLARRATVDR